MPIKIDIKTNINDRDLTVESCSEIIATLQNTYKSIRQDMYSYFLGTRNLSKALIFVGILLLFYFLTEDFFFVVLMPISVVLSLVISLASAEYITNQSKKIIQTQLAHYMKQKEILLKAQKIKV